MMNAGEAHTFIRHQSINEGKVVLDVTVRGKGGGFQHETVASVDIVHEKHKTPPDPTPPPHFLASVRAFLHLH